MPQITVTTVNGKVVVNGKTLESWEVLQYRKYVNDTIRFANKERVADLPILPSSLSEVSINGVVPTTFDELDAALLALFPALPSSPGGSSYLVYTALLNQSGTDAPAATILDNTINEDIIQTYQEPGIYHIESPSGAFVLGKTQFYYNNGGTIAPNNSAIRISHGSENLIEIVTYAVDYSGNSFTPVDGKLSNMSIEIRVYP